MKFTMKKILGGITLAASLLTSAQAVPLSGLLNGGSITAGDKLFDRWTVIDYIGSDPARIFNPANIDVTALPDGGLDPGPGLRFAVLQGELTVAGDGLYAFIDLMFGFRATALDTGLQIKDNTLRLDAGVVTNAGDNGFYVREVIADGAGNALAFEDVESSYLDPSFGGTGLTSRLSDSATFAPQRFVDVTKNILVWASSVDETASLLAFEQRFSQTPVPEPGSLALLALGLAGLSAVRRRSMGA